MVERSAARILMVEDESNVGSTLSERLTRDGFAVCWSKSAAEARAAIALERFDLAILDVGLPDGNGFEIGGVLREKHPGTAIVFLTAFGSPEDRVRGLELGAEDYVVKPFHLKELLLRIQNALKRVQRIATLGGDGEGVLVGKARVFFDRFQAETEGRTVALTHKEMAVLKLLVERKGQVVSRDEILDEGWSKNEFPTTRTVDNFIMKLRRLVERDPENPEVIRSVRGVGYQLILS
jgi:two-component system alkaline phosphatase synthesis response regulator PhoP